MHKGQFAVKDLLLMRTFTSLEEDWSDQPNKNLPHRDLYILEFHVPSSMFRGEIFRPSDGETERQSESGLLSYFLIKKDVGSGSLISGKWVRSFTIQTTFARN